MSGWSVKKLSSWINRVWRPEEYYLLHPRLILDKTPIYIKQEFRTALSNVNTDLIIISG